jgi:hypothetical protein
MLCIAKLARGKLCYRKAILYQSEGESLRRGLRRRSQMTDASRQRWLPTRSTSKRRSRTRTTATGALLVALACAAALPGHAQAATVDWSSEKPYGIYCGGSESVGRSYGYANIRECIKAAQSPSGTYYYNAVLEVRYDRVTGTVGGDVFGGQSAIAGSHISTGVNNCRAVRWANDATAWCYSPTRGGRGAPSGSTLYGKGRLLRPDGGWINPPVWSSVLTAF